VEGITDQWSSMRAKSYMRFGYGISSEAYYEKQVSVNGRQFFTVSSDFRSAAGLQATTPSGEATASAIIKGASHMSIRDPARVLYDVANSGVTLEAFVRIRDARVLAPPAQPDNNPSRRVGGTDIKLPIMGNLMHRGDGDRAYFGQGYQLACGYDGEPMCCAEAYTVLDSVNKPNKPSVSACVSIAPLLATADPGAPASETGWFHITGFFSGGQVSVMVNESSAYFSQSQYSAFDSKGSTSDSIQVRGKIDTNPEPATAFRLCSSMPFAANGDIIDSITNLRYLFLRADIDEVKIWVKPGKAVRMTQANFRDRFEGVSTCPMQYVGSAPDPGLVLYIKERGNGNAINSSITIPKGDMTSTPVSCPFSLYPPFPVPCCFLLSLLPEAPSWNLYIYIPYFNTPLKYNI